MAGRKYDREYLKRARARVDDALHSEARYDDWTQISISVQDAMQAAADVYGSFTDDELHRLNSLLYTLAVKEITNINKYDITFKEKNKQ